MIIGDVEFIEFFERFLIKHLEKENYNQSKVAYNLGINRNTLHRYLKALHIDSNPELKKTGPKK